MQTSSTHGEYKVKNYSYESPKLEIILSFLSGKSELTQTSYEVLVAWILLESVIAGSILQL